MGRRLQAFVVSLYQVVLRRDVLQVQVFMPWGIRLCIMAVLLWLTACATTTQQTADVPLGHLRIAATDNYTILIAGPQDTFGALAEQYLVQPGGNNIPIRGPFSASHEIRAPLSNW